MVQRLKKKRQKLFSNVAKPVLQSYLSQQFPHQDPLLADKYINLIASLE